MYEQVKNPKKSKLHKPAAYDRNNVKSNNFVDNRIDTLPQKAFTNQRRGIAKAKQFNVTIQRVVDKTIIANLSLNTPVFQEANTTACWFLSVLYGIHKAGWVSSLFFKEIIEVKLDDSNANTYRCSNNGRNITVVHDTSSRKPLWQQILEGFILYAINQLGESRPSWLKGAEGDALQSRFVGAGGEGFNRGDLQANVNQILKMIYSGWGVEDRKEVTPKGAGKDKSPLKPFIGSSYPKLTDSTTEGQSLELITAEKPGHAMGMKDISVKGQKYDILIPPKDSKSKKATPGKAEGLTASKIEIYNQSISKGNSQKYNKITPKTLKLGAMGTKTKGWAKDLDYLNYYKLTSDQKMGKISSFGVGVEFSQDDMVASHPVEIPDVGSLVNVSGEGMDCLIRALIRSATGGGAEDWVLLIRQLLVEGGGVQEGQMLDLAGADGIQVLGYLDAFGITQNRGIRVYYGTANGFQYHEIRGGENPINIFFDTNHFQAINNMP